jgi:hypothetical protein
LCAGCSFGFVAGPPANHAALASFSCSDSRAAPVTDTVIGALLGLAAVGMAGESDAQWQSDHPSGPAKSTEVAATATLAALATASAYYGYHVVNRCLYARRRAVERAEDRQLALPASWPPPPPAPASPAPAAPAATE